MSKSIKIIETENEVNIDIKGMTSIELLGHATRLKLMAEQRVIAEINKGQERTEKED
tara:strand:- start:681 stop:851 length:171 start_codon:yes stop_codon:yes gene_type:complete